MGSRVVPPDLYGALDLEQGATPAEVRRAYRRASKKAHPDGGGSAEKFALVRLACDVLSDGERRARYDADGTVEETVPDTRQAMALNLIAGAIDQVVAQLRQWVVSPEKVDLLALVRAAMEQKRLAVHQQKAELAAAEAVWRKLEGRFERVCRGSGQGSSENLLAGVVRGKLSALASFAGQCDAELGKLADALELLKDYRFMSEATPEPKASQPFGLGGWATTARVW